MQLAYQRRATNHNFIPIVPFTFIPIHPRASHYINIWILPEDENKSTSTNQ